MENLTLREYPLEGGRGWKQTGIVKQHEAAAKFEISIGKARLGKIHVNW